MRMVARTASTILLMRHCIKTTKNRDKFANTSNISMVKNNLLRTKQNDKYMYPGMGWSVLGLTEPFNLVNKVFSMFKMVAQRRPWQNTDHVSINHKACCHFERIKISNIFGDTWPADCQGLLRAAILNTEKSTLEMRFQCHCIYADKCHIMLLVWNRPFTSLWLAFSLPWLPKICKIRKYEYL